MKTNYFKNSAKKLAFIFTLTYCSLGFSQTFTWNGGGADNNFSTAGNWVGGIGPGFGTGVEDIIFDGTGTKNCDFDADVNVNKLSINAGYTGVVDAKATNSTFAGVFTLAAGTFISSSNTLIFGGNLTKTGGTFTDNSGDVEIDIGSGTTITISGAFTFYDMHVKDATPLTAALRTLDFSASSTVTNDLFLAGGTRPFAYKGTISLSNQLDIQGSNTSVPAGNTGIFNFNGASATIVGASAAGRNKLGNITINTTGAVALSGHISLVGTWLNTNISSFTTGTSTTNFYTSSALITSGNTSSTRAYFDNINIQTGATLNVTAGSFIDINGNFARTTTGVFAVNTGLLMFTGSGAHIVSGATGVTTMNAIEKSGTGSLSFSNATNLTDSIRITGGAVTITNVTLKSTSALKARIAEISGTGSISGSVKVETYIPGGTTDWAVLGGSGVSGLTFNSWYPTIPMAIEGSATGVTSAGGKYFESVQGWTESTSQYDTTILVTTAITKGVGYWLYVGTALGVTGAITTTVTGTPVSGAQSLPVTSAGAGANKGSCLLANPYASPISWDKIVANNAGLTDGSIYIYNADLGLTTSYAGGVSVPGGAGSATTTIPMGQGFYVNALGAGNLAIAESDKVAYNTSADPLLKNTATAAAIGNVIRLNLAGGGYTDGTAIRFHGSATTAFDNNLDATKYWDSPGYIGYPGVWTARTTISTKSLNKDYSINSLPYATLGNVIIPVLVKVYASGSHTITPVGLNNLAAGTCATLKDKVTGTIHDLFTGPYVFNINDTTAAPRFELTICGNIVAGVNNVNTVAENVLIKQDKNGVYVDLSFEKNTKAIISASNILGQEIMITKNVECVSDRVYLNLSAKEQIVVIKVITPDKNYAQKFFVSQN